MAVTSRKCYGCAGTGRRGVFECGVCGGTGKLTGPYVQAHADSFRHGALRAGGDRSPPGSPSCRSGPGAAVGGPRRIPTGEPRLGAVRIVDTLGGVGTPAGIMSGARPDRPATGGRRLD